MRSIVQPGLPNPERIQWVEARGRAFSATLAAGLPLLEATRRAFAVEGFAGGVLNFRGGALGPFAYVMPALSRTGDNAAFYSDAFRPDGVTRLKIGAMTLGQRDGAPFFHGHALWTEAGGRSNGGHILPEETIVAEAFDVYSHGEGFLRFFEERCQRQGIFIFDEPESALSPARQMEFLKLMRRMEESTICQVIMATHSPMLMAYPGARLLRLTKYGLDPVTVKDTDHYKVMREFCADPAGFVEAVMAE